MKSDRDRERRARELARSAGTRGDGLGPVGSKINPTPAQTDSPFELNRRVMIESTDEVESRS